MTQTAADRTLNIDRLVAAPRELVFKAFTDPEHIDEWWGPDGFTNSTTEMDVRPGGVWRFTMHGPDGVDYPNLIKYVEVVPPERIVFIHSDDSGDDSNAFHSTVTFTEEDGGTRVTLSNTFSSVEELERVVREVGAIEGGKQTLGRLAAFVEAQARTGQ